MKSYRWNQTMCFIAVIFMGWSAMSAQVKPDSVKSEQAKSEQAKSEQAKSEQAKSEQAKSEQAKSELVVINEMLFDIGGEAFTEYDYKIFKEVSARQTSEQLGGELFSQKVKLLLRNDSEMFIFTRLVSKEAQQLEISAPIEKQAKLISSVSGEALKAEAGVLAQASEYIGLKERLWSDRSALLSWLQVLKRKYDLNWKSYDFKKRTELGL